MGNSQRDGGSDSPKNNETEPHIDNNNSIKPNELKSMENLDVKRTRGRPKGSKNSTKSLEPPKNKSPAFMDLKSKFDKMSENQAPFIDPKNMPPPFHDPKDTEIQKLKNELKLRAEEVERLVNDVALKSGKMQELEKHLAETKMLFNQNNLVQQIAAKDDLIKRAENSLILAKKDNEMLSDKLRCFEGKIGQNNEVLLKDLANKDYMLTQQAAELKNFKMQI